MVEGAEEFGRSALVCRVTTCLQKPGNVIEFNIVMGRENYNEKVRQCQEKLYSEKTVCLLLS